MTPDELRALASEAEDARLRCAALLQRIDEERAQRESFVKVVDLVMQTRGGSLAWTLVSPIAQMIVEERRARSSYGYYAAAEGQGFHWRGGLYFRRDRDGSVILSDWRPFLTEDGEKKWTGHDIAVIDPDSWASIVASVSLAGETGARFEHVRAFHNGPGATEPSLMV